VCESISSVCVNEGDNRRRRSVKKLCARGFLRCILIFTEYIILINHLADTGVAGSGIIVSQVQTVVICAVDGAGID